MKLSGIAKRMILILSVILLLLIAASLVYYRSLAFLPFALGALLGTAANIAKVFLIENAVNKTVGMAAEKGGNYIRLQNFLRFLLTGTVLVAAAFIPFVSLYGAAAGILGYQVAALFLKNYSEGEN